MDYSVLTPAQLQRLLGEYQLGGKPRPRGWYPPPEEVEPALRSCKYAGLGNTPKQQCHKDRTSTKQPCSNSSIGAFTFQIPRRERELKGSGIVA